MKLESLSRFEDFITAEDFKGMLRLIFWRSVEDIGSWDIMIDSLTDSEAKELMRYLRLSIDFRSVMAKELSKESVH